MVLLHPSRASVRRPFLHWSPSKNEVPPVPIHPNKSTQHRLCFVYRPSQQSTHISPILELFVRQVRDRKFPHFCIDNANEAESMITQLFSSRHWCKVWFCTNNPVRVSPWHQNFLQHFYTMKEIVFVVLLLLHILCRLNNTELQHNPRPPAFIILDFRHILWIPVHCHIHWQTKIDPITTLSLPARYGIIITYDIRRRE